MAHIFLDESGDLGFSKRSSKWFLLALAVVNDNRSLERIVKKVWRSIHKKHRHAGELHAYRESDKTRKKMAQAISRCVDLKIMSVILNKSEIPKNMYHKKDRIYYSSIIFLLERLYSLKIIKDNEIIDFVSDTISINKSTQDIFVKGISDFIGETGGGNCSIHFRNSHENKSLQAVDFISWSIFRKYEHNNSVFYNLIHNRIIDESLLFPLKTEQKESPLL